MKARSLLLCILGALLAMLSLSSRAEDIELFTGPPADTTIPPNLLLVVANSAHSSSSARQPCLIDGVATALSGSALGVEQCALYSVIAALDLNSGVPANLGIMMFNGTGLKDFQGNDTCPGNEGGCLVYPLTPLTETSRTALLAWIKSWQSSGSVNNIKVNGEATGAAMAEAWAYYYGRVGLSGRDYASIAPNINCKNFVVFVADVLSDSSTPGEGRTASPKAALESAPGVTLPQRSLITLSTAITPPATACGNMSSVPDTSSNHETKGFYADEWTRYMYANRITTYTVGFVDPSKCKPDYPWLLSSMATNGGGTYFPTTDYEELVEALQTILSEVRSVNSVFAAVSLPVSVNSQGTYLNQVFIGMFRPDANGFPRWFGNLKQYKMGFAAASGAFSLLDADNDLALSASGSEFVAECARSFWTPAESSTGDNYWTLITNPNCTGFPAASNSPDGNMVEKGGQGYMLRKISPDARVVKTCSTSVSGCTSLTSFDASNGALTTTTFGLTAASPTAAQLINWARGSNNHATSPEVARLDGTPVGASHMRPSSHGDVVHSRPAAVNMGTDAAPKVVVVYGGNDGMLRAINGNRTAAFQVNGSSVEAGAEFWSFVPPEFYDKLQRRYHNSALIEETQPKDYAMDGPITAWRANAGDDVWLFTGLRRGGSVLYAFKIDKNTLNITLEWKIGCASVGNCDASGRFNDMGQSWSPPQVMKTRATGTTPLLIFGGGYDTCEDASPASCATPKGAKFYVVNATTGAFVRSFTTRRSVVGDVTIVPDAAGYAKFIYGADMGGNVYRISGPEDSSGSGSRFPEIGTSAVADWEMTTVARLGCSASAVSCTSPPNRKFMFAPDVVLDGNDIVLLLGSGDREKPTRLSNPTSNYFFMIKDRPDLGDDYLSDAACADPASLCLASLSAVAEGGSASPTDLASKKGWYLTLKADEQVVTGAIAVFGTVYFTTHQPQLASTSACVPNLGKTRAYAVKYTDASSARATGDAYIQRDDAGLAPDLVVGKVTLDNGSTVPFCIGCDGPIKPSQPIPPNTVSNRAKIRSYWYIRK